MYESLEEDKFFRLASAFMSPEISHVDAIAGLKSYSVAIIIGPEIVTSISLQVALLTAVNCAKRCFLGGIDLQNHVGDSILDDIKCPTGDNKHTLWSRLSELMRECVRPKKTSVAIKIGCAVETQGEIEIVASGWQGGFITSPRRPVLDTNEAVVLGAVAGAALAVQSTFMYVSGLDVKALDKDIGISLWKPSLPWQDLNARGPVISAFPKQLSIVGLGHLGQAYCWSLAFFPSRVKEQMCIMLQDFDKIDESNYGSGLLTTREEINTRKTRVCAKWLDKSGFDTKIIDRKYSIEDKRRTGEPLVVLGGLDNIQGRLAVLNSQFPLYIDCGLGGTKSTFDDIVVRIISDRDKPDNELWTEVSNGEVLNPGVKGALQDVNECGQITLANKAISTSFVGAFASAIVLSEILRTLAGGACYSQIMIQLRDEDSFAVVDRPSNLIDLVSNGIINFNGS